MPPLGTRAALCIEEKMPQVLLLIIMEAIRQHLSKKRLRRRKSLSLWVVANSIKPSWKKRRSLWLLQLKRRLR